MQEQQARYEVESKRNEQAKATAGLIADDRHFSLEVTLWLIAISLERSKWNLSSRKKRSTFKTCLQDLAGRGKTRPPALVADEGFLLGLLSASQK